ncbi:DUF3772 domain-containing protein [Sagittula salina]|uniref:Mechanosensitive ion channel family protein n=1 Tax=Sagittula salina TaxID=2820268 RepID=A0A940RZC7_9RHOB|nr:DUF3772 domain-containing protein [Sagittula salina]MBP0481848.1 mechanosensitive ion channel family protein [Sagittula salina]
MALARVFALALCVMLAAVGAQAQDVPQPDYTEWELRARADEVKLDLGTASINELESIRARMVDWRARFLAAEATNQTRISTVKAQIDALGAPPAEGEEEPADIAARRSDLNNQLAELRAPVIRAEEAYTRADGIIGEIDQIIRDRQADALLELGPSPVNPANWPAAFEAVTTSLRASGQEIAANVSSATYQAEARRNLPLILLLTAIGGMLLARGKHWAQMGVEMLRGRARRGAGVFRFLVSLGQILLPYIGIYALIEAISATGFSGTRLDFLLGQLQLWAALLFGTRWLADQTFHEVADRATVQLDDNARWESRRLANGLAWLYVARAVIEAFGELDNYSDATVAVVEFPLLLLTALVLFRLGRVISDETNAKVPEGEERSVFRARMMRVLGRIGMVTAVAGTVMAAVGYLRFGEFSIYPVVATLALAAVVMVLQRFIFDLNDLISDRMKTDNEGLLPVLAAFALSMAALPFLALIWGAREADLLEVWTRFREGFVFGDTRISPTDFLVVAIVFAIGYMLTRLLQGALKATVLPKTKIDKGGQTAITSGVGYLGIFTAAIVAITAGGLDLSSLAIVAGALSVGIGFGLQTVVSNFVSGIILLIERPISEGDWIEVNGTHGIVKDISVRSTRIETFDKFEMIVPNADLIAGTVSNYTRGNMLGRIIVPVGVAYGSDTRKVEKILMNIVRNHGEVLMNPAPQVEFVNFGADSLDFEIRAVLIDINKGMAVRTEIRHQVVEAFTEESIEIPFAQRDIWVRNAEAFGRGSFGTPGAARPTEVPPAQSVPGDGVDNDDADGDGGDGGDGSR